MLPFLFLLKILAAAIYVLIITVILFLILTVISRYYQKAGQRGWHHFTRILRGMVLLLVLSPIVLGPLIYFYATYLEPNWIQVRTLTVKDSHFHERLRELKIVQISDLHIEKVGYRERRLVSIVNSLDPDVILINGDFINGKEGWESAFQVLKQLRSQNGIYTILGNTDYYFASEGEILPVFADLGIKVLLYDNVKMDFGARGSFWLAGLSNKYGEWAEYGETKNLDKAFEGIPAGDSKILLIHDPEQVKIKKLGEYAPQLILAGDNHGGQIGIPVLWQFSDYANRGPYMGGSYMVNGIPLYVNRGIGMKNLNMRFLCRPEVTVIKLLKR